MAVIVKKTYRYRFYPTQEQESLLRRTFGCVRFVYNRALEARTEAWKSSHRTITYSDTSAMLTKWKKDPELDFLNDVSSVPLQQTLRHLQVGFSRYWKKMSRHPRFKSKRRSCQRAEFTSSAFSLDDTQLKIAKSRMPLDVVWSRPLPNDAEPSLVTVTLDRSERWHVSILFEASAPDAPQLVADAVAIDLGLHSLATLSTGEMVTNPQQFKREQQRIAKAHSALNKKIKGSANCEKAKKKLARAHAKVADRRRDHLHKLSTRLIRENQTIVIEDLAVENLKKKGGPSKTGINRSISDAAWGQFRSFLEYKALWYDRNLIIVDRFFPSSQLCSTCGARSGPTTLKTREWQCDCGARNDRDVNAAQNILAAGLAVPVCGGDGRRNPTPV